MSIHISKMSEEGKLEWLRTYERQNPNKYLRKFGKVTQQDSLGQPCEWSYIPPEEAVKNLKPSRSFGNVLGVKVDVQEKDVVVEQQFIDSPMGGVVGAVGPTPVGTTKGKGKKNV